MKKTLVGSLALLTLFACEQPEQPKEEKVTMQYPETKKVDSSDTYFGTTVNDPYRWLEDDMSNETAEWVKAQNKHTFAYLNEIPFKDKIKKRLEELWNYEKIGSPFKEGENTFYYKNNGLQNQYVIYKVNEDGQDEVFLDPNKFSEDGTTSLGGLSFSENGEKLAYSISEGGSDWRKVIVIDVASKDRIEDTIVDVKFSGISWLGNEGFYYSSYDKPEGSELSAKTDHHKVYFHKLGTPQAQDQLVFGGNEGEKYRYVGANVSEDNKYLFISCQESTSGNKLFMKDLSKVDAPLVTMVDHFDNDSYVMDNRGSKLYIVTNMGAPNKKVVTVDASNPASENWVDFIPETENVLSVSTGAGYIFTNYMVDAVSQVKQYDYEGKEIREIELPGLGSAGGFGGKKEAEVLYYSFSNYKTPGTSFAFNPKDGTSEVYKKPDVDFNSDDYVSEQVFFTSKDGTKVPMIITTKRE